jgi:hypothetical protein
VPGPIVNSVEEGIAYLKTNAPSDSAFELDISDAFTFKGKPDSIGAGMAVLLDKILGAGYEPNGFEQKPGFKIYRYKKCRLI